MRTLWCSMATSHSVGCRFSDDLMGHPRARSPQALLAMRRVLPEGYAIREIDVGQLIESENWLDRILDYAVIGSRIELCTRGPRVPSTSRSCCPWSRTARRSTRGRRSTPGLGASVTPTVEIVGSVPHASPSQRCTSRTRPRVGPSLVPRLFSDRCRELGVHLHNEYLCRRQNFHAA
jgi:hypothetical protein